MLFTCILCMGTISTFQWLWNIVRLVIFQSCGIFMIAGHLQEIADTILQLDVTIGMPTENVVTVRIFIIIHKATFLTAQMKCI